MKTRINLGNGTRDVVVNRCCRCGHAWQDKPMGFARQLACQKCGSEYWEWLNYAAPRRAGRSS